MSLVVNDEDLIYDDWFELRIQIGFYGSSWILNLNHMNDFPQNRGDQWNMSRLETRIKESGNVASRNFCKKYDVMKVKVTTNNRLTLNWSNIAGTRKVVNYAWISRSQKKFWWRTS